MSNSTSTGTDTPGQQDQGWSIRRWVLSALSGLIAAWLLAYGAGHLWPIDRFFEIEPGDWLGLLGSLVSAGIGGLIAGLILREQLKRQEKDLSTQVTAQSDLQREALATQRDEARREREVNIIGELVPFLVDADLINSGKFTTEDELRFEVLVLRWIPNSGLSLEDAKSLPRYVRSMYGLIAFYEAHRADRRVEVENGRPKQTFPSENIDLHISSDLKDQLVREVRERVGQLLTLPAMNAAEKRQFISGIFSFLTSKSQVQGRTLDSLMRYPFDNYVRIYDQ